MKTKGLDHIILTVSDTERSRKFYGNVLDFDVKVIDEDPDKSFYFRAGDVMIFVYKSRDPIPGDRFSENRIGLDHLSFQAPDQKALVDLAEKLKKEGVETQGVETFTPTGNLYIAFRDPDNIQLEYWLPHR